MYAHRIHTIDSAPQKPKSALGGLMQRLGLAVLACTLVIGATGSASAFEPPGERAIRALGDTFANAFVQKNAQLRASLFAEDATFVTPQGDSLQGRVAMVKDFGPEAQQAVNVPRNRRSPTTGSASSHPMSRSSTRSLPCTTSTAPTGRSPPWYRSTFSSWPSATPIDG